MNKQSLHYQTGALTLLYYLAALFPLIVLIVQERSRHHYRWSQLDFLKDSIYIFTFLTLAHGAFLVIFLASADFGVGLPSHQPEKIGFRRFKKVVLAAGLLCCLGFLWRGIKYYINLVWLEPIYPMWYDTLPLIESALHSFWHRHQFPYHLHETGHWSHMLTYPPGLWLPFSFPFLLGIDIRAWGVASLAAVFLGMTLWSFAGASRAETWQGMACRLAPALLPILFFQGPVFRLFIIWQHVSGFWLAILGWAIALRLRAHLTAGLFFGWCLISRPNFVMALPFFFMYAIRNWREQREGVIRQCVGAVTVGLAFGLPFFLTGPEEFIYGVNEWYQIVERAYIERQPLNIHGLGLAGSLYELGLAPWDFRASLNSKIFLLAMLFQALLWALTWKRSGQEAQLIRACGVSQFFFLYFSICPHFYIYIDPIILLLMAPPDFSASEAKRPAESSLLWRRLMEWGALPGFAVLCAFALWASARNPPDRTPQGELPFSEAKHLKLGFDVSGWVENRGEIFHPLLEANAYAGIVSLDALAREMILVLEVESPHPNALCLVYLNGQFLQSLRLDKPGAREFAIALPSLTLHAGNNLLRLAIRDASVEPPPGYATASASPEMVQELGLKLGQVRWSAMPDPWSFRPQLP